MQRGSAHPALRSLGSLPAEALRRKLVLAQELQEEGQLERAGLMLVLACSSYQDPSPCPCLRTARAAWVAQGQVLEQLVA